ncbi:hypothetical protein RND81_12G237200 [Saponaria officinalis]|uniref:DUF641 domain-containing protein n=1 Tax=Saponaria officinalis TaxID=3572 RepID=A0AAW1HER0_SAPOF
MDSVDGSATTPSKNRIARAFSKVLHVRAFVADGFPRLKSKQKSMELKLRVNVNVNQQSVGRTAGDALIAKVFSSVSSVKAAYAELQNAQSPYDVEGIQSSDQTVIAELKTLSELKQSYYTKKQFDPFPEKALLRYEIEERKNLQKTYEVVGRKLEFQLKLKDSEIIFLREKLDEFKKENRLVEKRLNESGQLSVFENLRMSGLSPNHFIPFLRNTVRSIRTFTRVLVGEMQCSGWNLGSAANVIHPGVTYWKAEHTCFAIESFVCKELFDCFHIPNFGLPSERLPDQIHRRRLFFERFTELKSIKAKDYLRQKPKSTFGRYCRAKYLRVVHPKMESSFFGNFKHRNLVNSGEFPETSFFTTFAEMAKKVWLLHCLAFSYEPVAAIFQFKNRCRFSEVYMESVSDEAFLLGNEPCVAFTVVPGFKIGKTCIQSQVYLAGA